MPCFTCFYFFRLDEMLRATTNWRKIDFKPRGSCTENWQKTSHFDFIRTWRIHSRKLHISTSYQREEFIASNFTFRLHISVKNSFPQTSQSDNLNVKNSLPQTSQSDFIEMRRIPCLTRQNCNQTKFGSCVLLWSSSSRHNLDTLGIC